MPGRLAWLLLFLGLIGGPRVALAEKVKTNQPAKLYDKQGEHGRVILKIKEGSTMTVLNKEGRWLKVRINGRTGFVPRSKVDMPDDDEIARNTRRRPFVDGRGTKRGFSGEEGPDDRVGADAVETRDRDGGSAKGGGDDEEEETTDEEDAPKGKGPKAKKPKVAVKEKKAKKPPPDDEGNADEEEPEDAVEIKDDNERPTAHLKTKTTVYSDPNAESDAAFAATKSTTLYPTGNKKGKYTEVENEEGDLGYVLTSKLEVSDDSDESEEPVGRPKGRQLDARARLGVTFIGQKMATAGGAGMLPDNYKLGTSAITLALGGSLLYPYSKQYVLGADAGYDLAKAYPGITVAGSTTSITVHNLNVRAVGGYDLKKKNGMMAFARLGLRYWSYQVANVQDLTKNTAKLPSEIITAPTLGAALSIPKLKPNIGLRFSLDAIIFGGSLKQTKGLEDGSSPSAKAACLGAGFTYRWKPEMDIQATYDLEYTKATFGAPVATSMRGHTGTSVSRTDVFHVVTVGVAKAF